MMWIVMDGKVEHVLNVSGISALRRGRARPAYKYEIDAYLKEKIRKHQKVEIEA